jgi:hypothetical protein
MGELVGGKDAEKSNRAMKAMMEMRKLNIAALQRAHDGNRLRTGDCCRSPIF